MDEIKPDIIHLHNIHNHYVNVRMLFEYIKRHNIPVVWTLHDCWSFTGWCAYFDYAQCDKWKTGCHDCPSKHDYPSTWFFDLSKSNYRKKKDTFCGIKNMILCPPSKWLGNLASKSFLNDYPIAVINNGVDTAIFKPTPSNIKEKIGIEGKKMILAVVCGYIIRKGADYLKQISSLLSEDEVLVWVGFSGNQFTHSDKIICISHTNDVNELAQYYSAADVFINTTLEENFPTVNIEALACGTPIVTFNTGGSIEAELDNENHNEVNDITYTSVGAVVPQKDLERMMKAVRQIFAEGKQRYLDACVTKAKKLYNKQSQYEKYVDLYKKILHHDEQS